VLVLVGGCWWVCLIEVVCVLSVRKGGGVCSGED